MEFKVGDRVEIEVDNGRRNAGRRIWFTVPATVTRVTKTMVFVATDGDLKRRCFRWGFYEIVPSGGVDTSVRIQPASNK